MQLFNRDTYVLSTGRQVYANNSIIGLSISEETANRFGVYEGYDGFVGMDNKTTGWTKAEKIELIDYMIAAWSSFKDDVIYRR